MHFLRLLRLTIWVVLLFACGLCAQTPPDRCINRRRHLCATICRGRELRLKTYRGKVVLLNFWATWCAPCQVELPRFDEWQKKYGEQGLQILAVSMDDNAAPVRKTVSRFVSIFRSDGRRAAWFEDMAGCWGCP